MQKSFLVRMGRPVLVPVALSVFLAACTTTTNTSPEGYITELPEGVLAVAAPYQDLSAVRIDPLTGCYVYRHVNVVETTFLPLRTRDGRPICTRPPGTPAPAS